MGFLTFGARSVSRCIIPLLKEHFISSARSTSRSLHADHSRGLLLSLSSRGLIQSISVPEKKKSYGNKTGRQRLYAEEVSRALGKEIAAGISPCIHEVLSMRPSVYCGFDPTADSLHVGHMLPIMALLHFLRFGYQVIVLVGGATAQLGDPTGKDRDRLMSPAAAQLTSNSDAISKQLETLFSNHAKMYVEETKNRDLPTCKILNNLSWYDKMTVDDFYSKVGNHMKINHMLERAVVKSRLQSGHGMSYTEFVYQCFQAYDWLHLFQEHDCCVQVGGYDQIGNIEDGYAFIWRSLQGKVEDHRKRPTLMGLTVPLLTSATGEKLGKVAGNAVWLRTSSSPGGISLVSYLDSLSCADVTKFLKALTFIPMESIERASEGEAKEMLCSYLSRLLSNV